MSQTAHYREQHAEIMDLVGQIQALLDPVTLVAQSQQAWQLLIQLSGKLSIHLAAEDLQLYPQCQRSSHAPLRVLGERFARDMQPISRTFTAYAMKWRGSMSIASNPKGFIADTQQVFSALGERVHQEETVLYVALDEGPEDCLVAVPSYATSGSV
ncbi:hemerythrin domain-containing protein [Roseateles sp. BYS180W]|uniref:Hemerythrin domain-containing protein n=1 Tax=Roseateles rivi TaxID=3299028 RepID=A0ABW7FWR9_9BURK